VTEIFVGVGSNVDAEENIRAGIIALAGTFGVLRLSPVYRNSPVGFEGDDFLNMVVAFDTDLGVEAIAAELEKIEAASGRERGGEKFGPRTLDIDLLLYGSEITRQGNHEIPRDEITRYAFVLKPLADLAGDRAHPGLGQTFEELWRAFDADSHPMEPTDLPLIK
jgi:2-amino-4-hydroxy-6-hydroxymethyldihydropteridine diphosphokinase